MARYRVGNKYLSQEEYDAEQDWKWGVGLFLFGAFATGYLFHTYVVNLLWNDIIRFIITVVPSIGVGYLLVRFRRFIRILIGLAVALLIIAVIVNILINMI